MLIFLINKHPIAQLISARLGHRYLLAILNVSHQQFGGSVPSSGHIVSEEAALTGRCNGAGEAKITHLNHALLRDEDVLWFDVTVDDLEMKRTNEHHVVYCSLYSLKAC